MELNNSNEISSVNDENLNQTFNTELMDSK